MFRQDTTELQRSCLLGRSMMLPSISGVRDVSSPRCSKGNHYFREKTVRHRHACNLKKYTISLPDVNQFSIITELLGTPPDDVIETIASENVRWLFRFVYMYAHRLQQTLRFVQSLPKRERIPFSQKLRTSDPDGMS